jgi:riboflavin kinase/FMN adenylyltransferase
METIRKISDLKQEGPVSVALGSFDGLHIGHTAVIKTALESGYSTSVFTFSEDPSVYLDGKAEYILTSADKEELLSEMEVRKLVSIDFKEVRDMSPEVFFNEILLRRMNAKVIVCGKDFRFGKNAAGDIKTLSELCNKNGLILNVVEPVMFDGEPISSTRIRKLLREGNVKTAAKMLGRPFSFKLKVIEGNRIGRTMGVPTINQNFPPNFVKPKFGVYASLVRADHKSYWGVTNIGVKPTIGNYAPLSETWIADYSGNLYGKMVRLCLMDFIRSEKKFSGLDELKDEIERNRKQAQDIMSRYMY